MRNVVETVLEFAEALNNNSLQDSNLPRFVPDASDEVPPPPAAAAAIAPGPAEVGSATAEVGATQQGATQQGATQQALTQQGAIQQALTQQGATQQGDNPDQAMSVPEQQLPAPEQPIQGSDPASDKDITHEAQTQLSAYQRHNYEPVAML